MQPCSDCVDLEKGVIAIKHSKGDKDRLVYLANDLKVVLKDYWEHICFSLATIPVWFFLHGPACAHATNKLGQKFSYFWARRLTQILATRNRRFIASDIPLLSKQ